VIFCFSVLLQQETSYSLNCFILWDIEMLFPLKYSHWHTNSRNYQKCFVSKVIFNFQTRWNTVYFPSNVSIKLKDKTTLMFEATYRYVKVIVGVQFSLRKDRPSWTVLFEYYNCYVFLYIEIMNVYLAIFQFVHTSKRINGPKSNFILFWVNFVI
jgi:hypothetical protein